MHSIRSEIASLCGIETEVDEQAFTEALLREMHRLHAVYESKFTPAVIAGIAKASAIHFIMRHRGVMYSECARAGTPSSNHQQREFHNRVHHTACIGSKI